MKERKKSDSIYQKACDLMPGGVNSPARAFLGLDMTPLIVASGREDTIWDVDGHSYIDYCMSWGSLILGHAHPRLISAATEMLQKGSSFGIATEIEKQLAEEVVRLIPSIEMIRFVCSGTEATMSALRLARGYTGKSRILKFDGNYHGHLDALLLKAGSALFHVNQEASSKGVPEEFLKNTHLLPYNDLERTREVLRNDDQIAAVIVEPVAGNMGVIPAEREFLLMLREETKKTGALLIFDEVITGFRVALKGAQERYGIIPDLTCFGKIIGGGFPVAAYGGRREIMRDIAPLGEVFQAGTLAGNPVAMCAGREALLEIQQPGFYETLEKKTRYLIDPIQEALIKQGINACVQSSGSMFSLFFGTTKANSRTDLEGIDRERFKHFFHYLFERGIYIPPSPYESWFISSSHSWEHLEKTKKVILEFVELL